MRDTSVDYSTGWLRPGFFEREYDPLEDSNALGALGEEVAKLPALGQKYMSEALADPSTRGEAAKLLRAGGDALSEQAQKDTAEFMHPTGRHRIVFKSFARQVGQKGLAAEQAIVDAMPYKDTQDGREALELARVAKDPEQALTTYFTTVALDAFAPDADIFGEGTEGLDTYGENILGYDDEDEAFERLAPYGMGMSKKWKKITKGIAIGVAVAAGVVVTGGLILPALGAALPAVVGAVGTVAGAVFKGKGGGGGGGSGGGGGGDIVVQQTAPGAPGGAAAPAAIEAAPGSYLPPQAQQAIAQMPPVQAQQAAYQQAIQAGAGDEEAGQIAEHMKEQSEVVHGMRPPTVGPGAMQAGMFGGVSPVMLAVGAAALFFLAKPAGGGGRYRRNPGRGTRYVCGHCGSEFTKKRFLSRHHRLYGHRGGYYTPPGSYVGKRLKSRR